MESVDRLCVVLDIVVCGGVTFISGDAPSGARFGPADTATTEGEALIVVDSVLLTVDVVPGVFATEGFPEAAG